MVINGLKKMMTNLFQELYLIWIKSESKRSTPRTNNSGRYSSKETKDRSKGSATIKVKRRKKGFIAIGF